MSYVFFFMKKKKKAINSRELKWAYLTQLLQFTVLCLLSGNMLISQMVTETVIKLWLWCTGSSLREATKC